MVKKIFPIRWTDTYKYMRVQRFMVQNQEVRMVPTTKRQQDTLLAAKAETHGAHMC